MSDAERNAGRCVEMVKAGDAEGLRKLLSEDKSAAEMRDENGVSVIMLSLYRGRRDMAEMIAGKKGKLDLFEAASLGKIGELKLGADGDGINSFSPDGFTALHFACFFGQPEVARWLIENGAKVDTVAANGTKVMPLHSAASARNLEAARALLEHDAPVDARQQAGWVPLHSAAQNGDRAMVELLLEQGADSKLTNDEGKSPAAVARAKGHEELAVLCESTAGREYCGARVPRGESAAGKIER